MRRLVLILLFLPLLFAGGPAARAHAVLEATEPTDGATLDEAPRAVLLRFNEPVALIRVQVLDGQGEAVDGATPEVSGNELRIELPLLGLGSYLVSYRVISLDSHPVSGALLFSIGAVGATPAPAFVDAGAAYERGWRYAIVPLRALRLGGLLGAGGLALFLILVGGVPVPVGARNWRLAGLGLALGSVAALLEIGVEGALLEGAPVSGLLAVATWKAGFATTLGPSLGYSLGGALLFAAGLGAGEGRIRAALAGLGTVLMVTGLLVTGHAAVAEPRLLFLAAMAVHALTVAFWIGSVAGLAFLLGDAGPVEAAPVVRGFSARAVPAVTLLLLAGLALAAIQLGSLHALATTGYGRVLVGKLAAVALLLGLAAANKWRFTPRLAVGDAVAHRRLRRFVALELGVMAGVLLLTAILVQAAPAHAPSAARADATGKVEAAAQSGDYMAMVEVTPAVAGRNAIRLFLHDADGKPVDPDELQLELAEPDRAIEPLRRKPLRVEAGRYLLEGPELAIPGNWRLTLRARFGDFDLAEFEILLPVRAP